MQGACRGATHAGEFHFRTSRIKRHLGRTSLIGYLYNPLDENPFLFIEGITESGIITPNRQEGFHVTHPETGSLGLLKEGLLLAHPYIPAQLRGAALHSLSEGVMHPASNRQPFLDTRTSILESQGILLGYN